MSMGRVCEIFFGENFEWIREEEFFLFWNNRVTINERISGENSENCSRLCHAKNT